MRFLDANIVIRYLIADDATKATRCERVFDKVAHGQETLMTHVLVVAEAIWVLTGTYRLKKERVVDALVGLLSWDGLLLDDKEGVLSALGIFRARAVDFVDAYYAVWMQARGLRQIYSYDKDFDLIPGLQRLEP